MSFRRKGRQRRTAAVYAPIKNNPNLMRPFVNDHNMRINAAAHDDVALGKAGIQTTYYFCYVSKDGWSRDHSNAVDDSMDITSSVHKEKCRKPRSRY